MSTWNLALECSGFTCSVAVAKLDCLDPPLWLETPPALSSVQGLAGMVRQVLQNAGIRQPDFLSVTHGPGSFTGLRVGLATAKTLGMAWDIPMVAIDTLEAIAFRQHLQLTAASTDRSVSTPLGKAPVNPEGIPATDAPPVLLLPVMNAFRRQVFAAAYESQPASAGLVRLAAAQVLDAAVWRSLAQDPPPADLRQVDCRLAEAGPTQESTSLQRRIVCGPGLEHYQPEEAAELEVAPAESWNPRAVDVLQLGWQKYLNRDLHLHTFSTADSLAPNYIRSSAAEEVSQTGNR